MRTIPLIVVFVLYSSSSLVFAQNQSQQRISGKVTEATTGNVLPGVNILIEGTYRGTITGNDGRYSIMVDGPESVLVFSFIGRATEKVTVKDQYQSSRMQALA